MNADGFVAIMADVAASAERTAARGTFGVSGVLLDAQGTVLEKADNKVIRGSRIDTTMHVEMQLVQWVRSNAKVLSAQPRSQLTIACSLEPCMMCAGAILREGLRCIALTEDPQAGVGVRRDFASCPPDVREAARASFFLAGHLAEHEGGTPLHAALYATTRLPPAIITRAELAFARSLAQIRVTVRETTFQADKARIAGPTDKPVQIIDGDARAVVAVGHRSDDQPTERPAADAYLHRPLLRAIRRFNRQRPLARADVRFLFRREFVDALDFVISLGAIGSFYESDAPRDAVLFVNVPDEVLDRYRSWLSRFPPFYTGHVGLQIAAFADSG